MTGFRRKWTRFWALVLAIGIGAELAADTLVFQNGDRLTGEFVRQDEGTIYFISEIMGPMEIDASLVEVILEKLPAEAKLEAEVAREEDKRIVSSQGEKPTAPEIVPAEPPPVATGTDDDSGEETIEVEPSRKSPEAVAVGDSQPDATGKDVPVLTGSEEEIRIIERLFEAMPGFVRSFVRNWESDLSFSLVFQQGENDREETDVRLSTRRQFGRNDIRISTQYLFSTTERNGDKRVIDQKYQGSVRYRFDFTDRIFFQNLTRYLRNEVRNIDHDFEDSIGVGWRFLDKGNLKASVTPAYTQRYKDFVAQGGRWEKLASLNQDFSYQITEDLRLREELNASINPTDTDVYKFSVSSELRADLTAFLDARLRYELEYDNDLADDIEKLSRKLSVALGMEF